MKTTKKQSTKETENTVNNNLNNNNMKTTENTTATTTTLNNNVVTNYLKAEAKKASEETKKQIKAETETQKFITKKLQLIHNGLFSLIRTTIETADYKNNSYSNISTEAQKQLAKNLRFICNIENNRENTEANVLPTKDQLKEAICNYYTFVSVNDKKQKQILDKKTCCKGICTFNIPVKYNFSLLNTVFYNCLNKRKQYVLNLDTYYKNDYITTIDKETAQKHIQAAEDLKTAQKIAKETEQQKLIADATAYRKLKAQQKTNKK